MYYINYSIFHFFLCNIPYLVGGLEPIFFFSIQLGIIIIPTDEYLSEWLKPPTRYDYHRLSIDYHRLSIDYPQIIHRLSILGLQTTDFVQHRQNVFSSPNLWTLFQPYEQPPGLYLVVAQVSTGTRPTLKICGISQNISECIVT